ncbi:MAG: alpha-2-macroglobulin [Methylococcales bacterium]|nr:alpha-2-macroglobulin [Methylococcales bacterium]
MTTLKTFLGLFFGHLVTGLTALFGVVHWQPPTWLKRVGNGLTKLVAVLIQKPLTSLLVVLGLVLIGASSWFAYDWWQSRPQPVTINFSVQAPERADIEKNAPPNPLVLSFQGSVAPIAQVGKEITQAIGIRPAITGHWRWQDDKTLEFRPDKEWPAGQTYQLTLAKPLVAPQIKLTRWEAEFSSPAFVASLEKAEFYQDPLDPALKKAVIQLRFSHPVDTASLQKNLQLSLKNASQDRKEAQDLPFTVTYDTLKLNAFIHSHSLAVPRYDQQVDFSLSGKVRAANADTTNGKPLSTQIVVPGLYNGLAINDVALTITPNKQTQQQDQILVINTTLPVHEQKMAKNLQVWLLPYENEGRPNNGNTDMAYPWSPDEVTAAVLAKSTPVALDAVPAEQEFSQIHGFRVQVDVGRQLFVKINNGISSFGGYQLPKVELRTLTVQAFPKELHILGEGSLLTLSGEKKIGLMARDLKGIKVELGRVLPGQLQNLISQSQGDFGHPNFYGDFGQDNLSERFAIAIPLSAQTPDTPNYQSVDLSHYMTDAQGQSKRGIFLMTATNYDPSKPNGYENAEATDKRLILVTDLGVIVKTEHDGGQVVFVQSIQTGLPQAGATVDIIGKNGLTLFSGQTDVAGKVGFPKLSGLERERQPLMYLVKFQGDMSFLPMAREDRRLNFSRFGIEGEANPKDANQLNAYLFSDRGIYRPGETFHIGLIVKTENWALPLEGLPLQAEITDARGLLVQKAKINLGPAGFNELSHTTLESSPTGNYTVSLYTVKDGHTDQFLGQTKVKVEEFQPDRIKTTAIFSKPITEGWVHPDDLKVTVNVQNLYGAPAEARKVEANITLKPALPGFKRYKDYNFYDPLYAKEGFEEALSAGTTDASGNAVFALDLKKYTKATYQVHFFTRAFEAEGGRSVAAEADTLVSDMPYLVGYKADGALAFVAKDSQRHVQLLAIDPQVQATAVEGLSLELLERKVLSVLTRQTDNTYKYESRLKETSLHKDALALPKTGHDLLLDSSTPGDYSYVLRNAEGLLLSRIDYSVAGNGNVSRTLDRNAELQLTLDKPEYEPGEKIAINIRAPYTGAGLITIERDKVYNSVWFKADTQASVQTIEVPKELTGNAYVSVQYIRDTGSDEIFMSPLSYGVAPFKISLASHTQALKLTVPERIKPGQTLTMQLHSPEPTRVVVFAVDEGILQVARYQNPDPLGHFFKKRQLAVETTQILDLILPEFKKLMQAAATGGDAQEDKASFLNPFKRKHDKPAVYWSGIVDLNGGQSFNYQVPDTFNGTMRLMAVAVNQGRIASVSSKTQVRGDLIVTPNAPYIVSPGDTFKVSVAVANHVPGSGDKATVTVSLTVPPQLKVLGEAQPTVVIAEGHEGVVTFQLQAETGPAVVLGNATLAFVAKAGGQTTNMASDLSIRPASPKIADLRFGSFTSQLDLPIERDLYPQLRKVSAGVSPLPLISVAGLTSYLDNFEHSCTEQLLSKAIPMLVLDKHPEFAEAGTVNTSFADFARLIAVLRSRQNAEGGFGLWGPSPQAHEFASVYAVNLLMEAQASGIPVPDDMLKNASGYLQNLAGSPAQDLAKVRVRAYAAYLLTRQGVVTTALLSTLRENLRVNFKPEVWRNDLAAVYLAASYQLLQQQNLATDLISTPLKQLGLNKTDYSYQDYYDPLIHDAQTLYILAKHFPTRLQNLPPAIFQSIAQNLADKHYNTLSSGYLLLAYSAYMEAVPPAAMAEMGITAIDGAGVRQVLALPSNYAPRVSFPEHTKKLHFTGPNALPLYYAVSESGYDVQAPSGELRNGLEIMRTYLNAQGQPVDKVALGEEITVQLRVRAIDREWISDLVVQDLLPAGFEAVIQTPVAAPKAGSEPEEESDSLPSWQDRLATGGNWTPEYADVREDRVVLYGIVTNELAEYRYKLKATSSGTFNVPPVYAEAMYEPTLRARSGTGKISVAEQEKAVVKP